MKTNLVFVGFLLLAIAVAQQQDERGPKGVIYGIAIGQDGRPAKGVGLTAGPLGGGPLSTAPTTLPRTRTTNTGEYRFESLPLWGRYAVYAEDDDAGYSLVSTGAGRNDPPEVELTPAHREAELKVYLPPKAGFLHVRLTNRRTGAGISGMQVAVMLMEKPELPLFIMSCYSNHVVLVPSDRNLLLHVISDGFHEWDESVGRGKPLHLSSGARLTLDTQLDPLD